MGKGIVRELGMDMYTLLYLKWYRCTYSQNTNRLTDLKFKLTVFKGEAWGEEIN